MAKKYAPIRKTKASDLIVEEIWSSILNGELKPGDRLPPERELVEQFDVSKVTLREALQTLEANGYIERKRGVNGGSIVLELAPTKGIDLICEYLNAKGLDIEEIISARLILDPIISESAARIITPKEAHQLTLLIEKHKKEYDRTGKSKFGYHFEQYLAKLTHNKMLIVFVDLLIQLVINIEKTLLQAHRNDHEKQNRLLNQYYRDTYAEHCEIAEAIINHNPEKAHATMLQHRHNWADIFRKLCEEDSGGKQA